MTENKSENRGRVLIVEDEFLIALDLEAAMSGLGFEICGLAPNGEEARSLAMDQQPDVVLVDVYLGARAKGSKPRDGFVMFVTPRSCL
jgi:two-component system, response regulator PdtaR